MAVSRVKVWSAGEILYASDLNSEFNNVLNNALSLISPLTTSLNAGGFKITNYGGTDAPTAVTDVALNAFVQSGTGAVTRTLQAKIRESVSVTDFYANGVSGVAVDPTGVVDSTLGIQAAHDALGVNGGAIFFPPGSYLATNLTFTKRVHLYGTANLEDQTLTPSCQIIKKSTATGNLLTLSGFSSIVERIVFIGQVGNAGDLVQIKGNGIVLRDVALMKAGANGLRIGHSDSTNCNSWYLERVVARANIADGVYIHSDDSGVSINANAGTAVGLSCSSNGTAGLHLKNAQKNTFIGPHTESNTVHGINLESASGCQRNVFLGGDQEGNTTADVFVGANATVNVFINPGVLSTFTNNSVTTYISDDRGVQLPNVGTVGTGTIATKFDKWYEEGTFTPQLFIGATELTAQGTPGVYGVQIGRYRRRGNWVDFTIIVNITAKGAGGGGALSFGNLPYLTKNVANYLPALPCVVTNVTFAGALGALADTNARRVYIESSASAGARTNLSETALNATSGFTISGCYECDDNG